jgi:hypothetical protein
VLTGVISVFFLQETMKTQIDRMNVKGRKDFIYFS